METKLHSWWDSGRGILDVRSKQRHLCKRLRRAMFVGPGQVKEYLYRLPSKSKQLAILAETSETADEIVTALKGRGWESIKPIFIESDAFWNTAETLGAVRSNESNVHRRYDRDTDTLLIEPSKFFVSAVQDMERLLSGSNEYFTCCDLGSGSGRNAVFLASRSLGVLFPSAVDEQGRLYYPEKELSPAEIDFSDMPAPLSWKVTCVDCHPTVLEYCASFIKSFQLEDYVEVVGAKLCGDGSVKHMPKLSSKVPTFHNEQFDLVMGIRFCQKPFFNLMRDMVKPGGFVIHVIFLEGVEKPRNVSRLVRPGELKESFGESNGFECIRDEVMVLDDGRRLSCYLGRKFKTFQ